MWVCLCVSVSVRLSVCLRVGVFKKVLWKEDDTEKWLGAVPKIELTYDDRYMFVLAVTLMVDTKKSNATEEDLLNIFLQVQLSLSLSFSHARTHTLTHTHTHTLSLSLTHT